MSNSLFKSTDHPRLLVSVRDAAEAQLALDAGVDVIDVKDPGQGSLGAATTATMQEIVEVVGNNVPCSAACGELADGLTPGSAADSAILEQSFLHDSGRLGDFLARDPQEFRPQLPTPGFAFGKIGLSRCARIDHWRKLYQSWMAQLPAGCQAVAVCYADAATAEAPEWALVLREAKRMGCAAILLDTFEKHQGGLLDLWRLGEVAAFIAAARATEMQSAISGSIDLGSVPALLELEPDFIAIRGAICVGDRSTSIDPNRLQSLVGLFHSDNTLTR
ncbi:MAG: (5-formylfuran-3-yl)methyl phosphate synthase [Pirellulales bacterium]|nr:(5-formylfuran-3-yl)methyl phosphate synthase [Pirellulales bacterium]